MSGDTAMPALGKHLSDVVDGLVAPQTFKKPRAKPLPPPPQIIEVRAAPASLLTRAITWLLAVGFLLVACYNVVLYRDVVASYWRHLDILARLPDIDAYPELAAVAEKARELQRRGLVGGTLLERMERSLLFTLPQDWRIQLVLAVAFILFVYLLFNFLTNAYWHSGTMRAVESRYALSQRCCEDCHHEKRRTKEAASK
jgi:hypothetical protein